DKQTKEEFWAFVNVIFSWALIGLSLITISGIFLADWIVRAIAPGFMEDSGKLLLTIDLTKTMFPYLIFIGLVSYCMGLLYTFRSFVVPAFSPCLLNISLIISALWASRYMDEPVLGLAVGVLIGGILQLLAYIKPLRSIGFRYKIPKSLKHPGAKKIGRLLVPRMFGAGVYQLTVLIDTLCASLSSIVGVGGISAVYYANRIIHFPLGIFGVALASAVLPTFSSLAHEKNYDRLKQTLVFALENIFFVMCPTMVMMFVLADPIIRVLFERGAFDSYSTMITSGALSFYALGLFAFGGIKIMVAAFHALQDTKTPVKVAALCLVINAILNVVLMFPMKISGIALASAIAGSIDLIILFYLLNKRLPGISKGVLKFSSKVIIAALVTGVCGYLLWHNVSYGYELVRLFVIGISGFIIYGVICYALGVEQVSKLINFIRTKLGLIS
ncbi:MAG: putative peptidoglycan lipid II flippase, partial [Candidatus Omnitrophota bacterium]